MISRGSLQPAAIPADFVPIFYTVTGIVVGLVFSATMVAGVVWSVTLVLRRSRRAGVGAALGIAAAQVPFAISAGAITLMLQFLPGWSRYPIRLVVAAYLIAMAVKLLKSRPALGFNYEGPLKGFFDSFKATFWRALYMPLRLAGYTAVFLGINLHLLGGNPYLSVLLGIGVGIGSALWWLHFVLIAALFGRAVPEDISLRSVNKIPRLGAIVFIGIATISLIPFLLGF